MTLPTYTNDGRVMFDVAITGLVDGTETAIPFLVGQTKDYPMVRESEKGQREQVDFSAEPGEQSLRGWWYRSQSSFDLGAGVEFMDAATDQALSRRFNDSCGVHVFDEGQVSLLRDTALEHSVTGSSHLVPYSNGGEEGVLHAHGSTLTRVSSSGTTTGVTWGGSGTILALCSDGGNYYAVNASGVYRGSLPGGSGTKIYNLSSVSSALIGYYKERLVLCADEKVYELTNTNPSPAQSLPTALSDGPQNGWTWTGIADGPDSVYLSGYVGNSSSIYSIGLDPQSAIPALSAPSVAQDLPSGEVTYTIESYMGIFLAVGTSLGVRVGLIGQGGRLELGPLSLRSDLPVKALVGYGEHIWAGGCISRELGADEETLINRAGLYKLNLRKPLPNERGQLTGQYAYSRDIYYGGATAGSDDIVGIAPVGQTGRIAFALDGTGVVMEKSSALVARGYLTTGRIRMDTWEDKVYAFLRVTNSVTDGGITAQWRGEDSDWAELYSWDTDAIRRVDTEGSDQLPHLQIQYRFVLTRGGDATSNTPILTGYQVRSQPSGVVQRMIRLVLQCYPRERTRAGVMVTRETWSRVEAIEAAEARNAPVLYQDLGTGETSYALVEKCQFVSQHVPEFGSDRQEPGGLLLVTLRKIT